MQDIRTTLNISIASPFWEDALEKALHMPAVPQWLSEEFLLALENDFFLLRDFKEPVLQAMEQVVVTPELCLLAKVLYHILGEKKSFKESFPRFSLPKAPEGLPNTLGYDFVGLFPILAHARVLGCELSALGISHKIIYDTLSFFRSFIKASSEQAKRPCFSEDFFALYPVYIFKKYLWIGRLRFEFHPDFNCNVRMFTGQDGKTCLLMCDTMLHASGNILGSMGFSDAENAFPADFRETDEFYEGYAVNPETHLAEATRTRLAKQEWQQVIKPGDALIKVHIPKSGKLLKEECEASYAQALPVFQKVYPEYDFKGFVCCTWMLCPAFRKILKPDSNILHFQDKYTLFPLKDPAVDVLRYVFDKAVSSVDEIDASALPEDNTMQRGVKKLLLAGEYIHNYGGLISF